MTQPGPQSRLAVLVLVAMAGAVIMAGVMTARVWMVHNAQDAPGTLLQHLDHSGPGAPASRSLFRPHRGPMPGMQQSGPVASRNGLPVGAGNLCHQAIFVDDATHAVMPPDPEMLTAALLLLAAGRGRRQAEGN